MQCKDIPDRPVLEFLRDLPDWDDMPGIKRQGTWFWHDGFHPKNSVVRAMPDGTTQKLARVKMGSLIRRGLVNGCACGCRGEFELTDKGLATLAP